MPVHLPMEIPTNVGSALVVRGGQAMAIVMPLEVYTTGALIRVRAYYPQPPAELVRNPGLALVHMPGKEAFSFSMSLGASRLPGRRVDAVRGQTDGPGRWDIEFWWERAKWSSGDLLLEWPVAELQKAIAVQCEEMHEAVDKVITL